MYRLVETLKIKDGRLFNVQYHNARMNAARSALFHCTDRIDLRDYIAPTQTAGLTKCRVLYDEQIRKVAYIPYQLPHICSLQMIAADDVTYTYKLQDRRPLRSLYNQRGVADDILVIRNGLVTDTFFCNVVFERSGQLVTPASCLLKGTKRQQLLDAGTLTEAVIRSDDVYAFDQVILINAMIDLEDRVAVKVENLLT